MSYHACFHDTPEGLKTHVYAPLGLDIRGKWSVGGSLPGEPKHVPEKGVKAPRHGLYIREDVTMTCSSLLMGFVKRTFKDSHASLVEKLVERAHLLESNFANERLRALRNVSPGDRMAIGDIFIAPPPDYRPWGYVSPCPESPDLPSPAPRFEAFSAPAPSPLHRTLTVSERSPQYNLSPHSAHSHSRSQSDPIASPGFSSSSTLVNDSDRPPTPPKETLQLPLVTLPASPAPAPNLYLLPATTYDGGRTDRLISLHPGGSTTTHTRTQSDVSSNAHSRNASNVSFNALRISYEPQERPMSFTISRTSAFDTKSRTSSSTSSNQNILDEIDDAIDQVFLFTVPSDEVAKASAEKERDYEHGEMLILPATKYEAPVWKEVVLPQKKYEPVPKAQDVLLPATKYEPEQKQVIEQKKPVLPSTTYTPARPRKDSVVPWTDKELPPVPIDG